MQYAGIIGKLLRKLVCSLRTNYISRQSLHRANPYTNKMTERDVRRLTVIDDGPLAFGATADEKLGAGWKLNIRIARGYRYHRPNWQPGICRDFLCSPKI